MTLSLLLIYAARHNYQSVEIGPRSLAAHDQIMDNAVTLSNQITTNLLLKHAARHNYQSVSIYLEMSKAHDRLARYVAYQ